MAIDDDSMQAAYADVVRELFADGSFRHAPCRACGQVTFFSDPREEFCVNCQVEHAMMRRIALAPDRYCPHCDTIRGADGASSMGLYADWREHPPCLACGEAGWFYNPEPDVLAHLCLHCEAKQVFEEDPFCVVCGVIEWEMLQALVSVLRR
jgi:ribosomal protein L37E